MSGGVRSELTPEEYEQRTKERFAEADSSPKALHNAVKTSGKGDNDRGTISKSIRETETYKDIYEDDEYNTLPVRGISETQVNGEVTVVIGNFGSDEDAIEYAKSREITSKECGGLVNIESEFTWLKRVRYGEYFAQYEVKGSAITPMKAFTTEEAEQQYETFNEQNLIGETFQTNYSRMKITGAEKKGFDKRERKPFADNDDIKAIKSNGFSEVDGTIDIYGRTRKEIDKTHMNGFNSFRDDTRVFADDSGAVVTCNSNGTGKISSALGTELFVGRYTLIGQRNFAGWSMGVVVSALRKNLMTNGLFGTVLGGGGMA